MAARATLALKPGVWFRRGRLLIVSPDSLGTACPLSGRNSTYRLVQILEAGSYIARGGQIIDASIVPVPTQRNVVTRTTSCGLAAHRQKQRARRSRENGDQIENSTDIMPPHAAKSTIVRGALLCSSSPGWVTSR